MGSPHGNVQGVAATNFPSHQLSSGLYVSGRPDQGKEKGPTMSVSQMPYTGGDVKKSGELGKMFDTSAESSSFGQLRKSGSLKKLTKSGSAGAHSGPMQYGGTPLLSFGPLNPTETAKLTSKVGSSASKSGPLVGSAAVSPRESAKSGPLISGPPSGHFRSSKSTSGAVYAEPMGTSAIRSSGTGLKTSGPLSNTLPTTGLISGPIPSGPGSPTYAVRNVRSGPLAGNGGVAGKLTGPQGACSTAVNKLSHDQEFSFRKNFPRIVLWTVVPLFVMGFIAGAFIIAAVQNAILLIVVGGLFFLVLCLLAWNSWWGKRSVTGFLAKYPDAELATAQDGQYVKITGVVTCGSIPLESSYEKVNRCVYTSTSLFEYRNFLAKPAASTKNHRWFTWGMSHMERYVVDFYISDFQTGLRALVKSGHSARITPYVEESEVVDITSKIKELPSDFRRWLTERKLSSGERDMKLKEGYIKEGSTVTVLGVVQRHENVLMIVPPAQPVSTGCQWTRFLLPANLEGIILACDIAFRNEGVPV